MSRVWVPPRVARELVDQTREREAKAAQALAADQQYAWKKQFDADLERVDPYLQLVWCPDPAPVEAVAAGATPGRWHICRHNPGAPMSFIALEDADGAFREPGAWVFDMLARSDLWNDRVERDQERVKRRAEHARVARDERERAERREELKDRVNAAFRTQVLMSPDVRWSQNVAGGRGRRGR